MSFTIFYIEKTPLQPIKKKSRKTDIFPKGLTHSFGPKLAIFPTFFFWQYRPGRCLLRYSRTKKRLSTIKTRSSKRRKIYIFSKGLTHGFGPKMTLFPTFSFCAIQARKMCFAIFENEKPPFQAIKPRSSKSPKIEVLPNGLTHGFYLKMVLFSTFIFYVIQARKMSLTIFQNKKNAFLGHKNKKFKKLKN